MVTESERHPTGFAAWGGISGIGYLVLLVAAIATIAPTGVSDQVMEREAFATIARTLEGSTTLAVASMWLFNLAHVALVLFAAFVLRRWGPTSGWVTPGAVLVMTAAALFVVETSLTIGLFQVAAPALAAGAGGGLETAADVLLSVRNHTAFLAGGVLGLGTLALAGAWLRELRGSPWLGYVAAVAGVLGVAGAFTVAFAPLTYLRAPGIGLFALWCGIIGWRSATEEVPGFEVDPAPAA